MLAGTLTYDMIAASTAPKACGRLIVASAVLMAGGYFTNCLSRLYDENPELLAAIDAERESLTEQRNSAKAELDKVKAEIDALAAQETPSENTEEQPASAEMVALKRRERVSAGVLKGIDRKIGSLGRIALDPVIPSGQRLEKAQWAWAEYPFIRPEFENQEINYWLMDKKRMVSLPFTLFSTGFGLFLYCLFIVIVDVCKLELGVFRTMGQNPLAAYIIHEMLLGGFEDLTPEDGPLNWGLLMFAVFFTLTYMMVRYLEKNRLFLRL